MAAGHASGEPSSGLYWILLHSQPQEEILRRVEEAAQLKLQLTESRYQQALERAWLWPDRADSERQAWLEAQREVRAAAFREIERTIEPEQQAVAALVQSLGGRMVRRYASINVLLAELPEAALDAVRQHELVAGVWPDPGPVAIEAAPVETHKLAVGARQEADQLFQNTPPAPAALSMGAGPLWDQNLNGAGEWVGLIAAGLNRDHPMFRGVRAIAGIAFLQRAATDANFADQADPFVDVAGSTGFASLLVGRGMAGGWEGYRGVASGSSLLIIKANYRRTVQQSFTVWTIPADLLDAWEWLVRYRPEVKLVWSLFPNFTEYYATTYDLFSPVRSGLVPETDQGRPDRQGEVSQDEGGLHSLLTVASVDTRGTADRSDDVIAPASARGPTTDGRRKPDVAAPAWGLWGAASGSHDMIPFNFTSNGPVNVLGAAALLRQAGVKSPLELKALLINSTDRTQWSRDWGWGAVDVGRAYQQRSGVVSGTVAPGSRAYFRGSVQGQFSATLAWNRQVQIGNLVSFPWPGCLANLDLRLYRASAGALVGASTSASDSVERVIGSANEPVVVKVTHAGNPCRNPEPFALAISQGALTKLSGPSLSASCAPPPQVVAGRPFTLTCTVTNRGDLTSSRATGSLQLGTQSAAAQIGFGDLGPAASSVRSVTLDAPATAGSLSWRLDVSATAFDDPLSASASGNFNVVAAGAATQPVIALSPTQFYLQMRATDAPVNRKLQLSNSGAGALNWTASSNQAWLQVTPSSGSGAAELTITVQPGLLPLSLNVGNLTISAPGLPAQSVTVIVELIGAP
ncbi:MAG: BACON domain-containing protein, partial [Bryobacteraceae bacterium]